MWLRRFAIVCALCGAGLALCAQSLSQPPVSSALHTLSDAEVAALLQEAQAMSLEQSATIDKLSLRLSTSNDVLLKLERDYKWLWIGCAVLVVTDALSATAQLVTALRK